MASIFLLYAAQSNSIHDCKSWADSGECTNNPRFMLTECASECSRIGILKEKYSKRCPPPKTEPILKPNQIHSIFQNMLQYKNLDPELVSSDPPIVVFNNFATDDEISAFLKHGEGKYTRSTGLEINKNGNYVSVETSIRTSLNTWCQDMSCLEDIHVKTLTKKVEQVTQVPSSHFEYTQLLYYFPCNGNTNCSFYKRHHDFISGDVEKNQGPRIYTCFIYLNDVEEGGHTVFDAGISVKPQKGRAVIWPNVKPDNVFRSDERTFHEATPVKKGEKYGANIWIHQFDFKTPHTKGCTH